MGIISVHILRNKNDIHFFLATRVRLKIFSELRQVLPWGRYKRITNGVPHTLWNPSTCKGFTYSLLYIFIFCAAFVRNNLSKKWTLTQISIEFFMKYVSRLKIESIGNWNIYFWNKFLFQWFFGFVNCTNSMINFVNSTPLVYKQEQQIKIQIDYYNNVSIFCSLCCAF